MYAQFLRLIFAWDSFFICPPFHSLIYLPSASWVSVLCIVHHLGSSDKEGTALALMKLRAQRGEHLTKLSCVVGILAWVLGSTFSMTTRLPLLRGEAWSECLPLRTWLQHGVSFTPPCWQPSWYTSFLPVLGPALFLGNSFQTPPLFVSPSPGILFPVARMLTRASSSEDFLILPSNCTPHP